MDGRTDGGAIERSRRSCYRVRLPEQTENAARGGRAGPTGRTDRPTDWMATVSRSSQLVCACVCFECTHMWLADERASKLPSKGRTDGAPHPDTQRVLYI